MNCWFCQQSILPPYGYEPVYCYNSSCQNKKVFYIINDDLSIFKSQFTTIFNNEMYNIKYFPEDKEINISHEYSSENNITFDKMIFERHYESMFLTPKNIDIKLPTILLLL